MVHVSDQQSSNTVAEVFVRREPSRRAGRAGPAARGGRRRPRARGVAPAAGTRRGRRRTGRSGRTRGARRARVAGSRGRRRRTGRRRWAGRWRGACHGRQLRCGHAVGVRRRRPVIACTQQAAGHERGSAAEQPQELPAAFHLRGFDFRPVTLRLHRPAIVRFAHGSPPVRYGGRRVRRRGNTARSA